MTIRPWRSIAIGYDVARTIEAGRSIVVSRRSDKDFKN
jgi:hypothetical protein